MHRAARRNAGLERHRLPLGERQDTVLAEPAGELGAPPPGAVLAGRDDGHGAAVDGHEGGPCECARPGRRVGERHPPPVREP